MLFIETVIFYALTTLFKKSVIFDLFFFFINDNVFSKSVVFD